MALLFHILKLWKYNKKLQKSVDNVQKVVYNKTIKIKGEIIMNKQEAIEEIKNLKGLTILDNTINFDDEMVSKKEVLNIVKQFDEPVRPPEPKPLEIEKPVVPQYVADWYEEHKDDFEFSVQCLCVQGRKPVRQLDAWFDSVDNKPIETLVMMHKFGYEIEKEKLYTVEIPNPNYEERPILFKKRDGKVHIIFPSVPCWRTVKNAQLTEAEIKKDFSWAWEFAEEVEE